MRNILNWSIGCFFVSQHIHFQWNKVIFFFHKSFNQSFYMATNLRMSTFVIHCTSTQRELNKFYFVEIAMLRTWIQYQTIIHVGVVPWANITTSSSISFETTTIKTKHINLWSMRYHTLHNVTCNVHCCMYEAVVDRHACTFIDYT